MMPNLKAQTLLPRWTKGWDWLGRALGGRHQQILPEAPRVYLVPGSATSGSRGALVPASQCCSLPPTGQPPSKVFPFLTRFTRVGAVL